MSEKLPPIPDEVIIEIAMSARVDEKIPDDVPGANEPFPEFFAPGATVIRGFTDDGRGGWWAFADLRSGSFIENDSSAVLTIEDQGITIKMRSRQSDVPPRQIPAGEGPIIRIDQWEKLSGKPLPDFLDKNHPELGACAIKLPFKPDWVRGS